MDCSKLTIQITILMSVLSLFYFQMGFGITGACRPICARSNCVTVNQDRVDFKTAEELCRGMNGQLMTFQDETDESILHSVRHELFGNYWVGLRLPAGACSNLSASLRGYKWTSGSTQRNFIPSFTVWKTSVKVCSPHCVSLSNNQKWTERLCSDKTDGFLCRMKHGDTCKAHQLSDPNFFQSSKSCSDSPCEHQCTDVEGGYKCSCFQGYIPNKKDRKRCKIHCEERKCPIKCDKSTDECFCSDGYIKNDKFCEDIDECSMDQCDHGCKNTFGGFVCSCREGFVLKGGVKCIKGGDNESFPISTPLTIGFIKPAVKNMTLNASAAPNGGFIWIWVFVALTMIVLIFVVRCYVVKRQKHREQYSNQQHTATAAVDNI